MIEARYKQEKGRPAGTGLFSSLRGLLYWMGRQGGGGLLMLWFTLAGMATTTMAAEEPVFLAPEVAFSLSGETKGDDTLRLHFSIAPGYYLYREPLQISSPDGSAVQWAAPRIPSGVIKFDENFQKDVETYHQTLDIEVPLMRAPPTFRLVVKSQGCAEKGICYPPFDQTLEVSLKAFGGVGSVRQVLVPEQGRPTEGGLSWLTTNANVAKGSMAVSSAPVIAAGAMPADDTLAGILAAGRWWVVAGVFLVAGVLLSFTPCVLPMIPIVSSIVVGETVVQGDPYARWRGLSLSATYALGMALVYTAMGIAAGLIGEGLAAALQHPLVLGLFALLMVGFALSMFGWYELQLPQAVHARLHKTSSGIDGGHHWGVFAMGGVSALIVSPCVAAPLAGALLYISQTKDVVLGGTALFALATGMSVPLLLVGGSAGVFVPRGGAWMMGVKHFFGFVLLGVAIWTVQPVLPPVVVLALWGAWFAAAALALVRGWQPATGTVGVSAWVRRVVGAGMAMLALLLWGGAMSGAQDPWQPWSAWVDGADESGAHDIAFQRIRSVAELESALRSSKKPVLLDFYADWCVSCKEMERLTFSKPQVRRRLSRLTLLQVDVTANSEEDRALLRRYRLFGPPGIVMFNAQGQEIVGARVIGFQRADRFLASLTKAGL